LGGYTTVFSAEALLPRSVARAGLLQLVSNAASTSVSRLKHSST
jgi:hypothetical protein